MVSSSTTKQTNKAKVVFIWPKNQEFPGRSKTSKFRNCKIFFLANIDGSELVQNSSPTFVDSERLISVLSYTPEDKHGTQKLVAYRCFSFSNGDILRFHVSFGGCYFKLPINSLIISELMSDFSSLQVYAVLASTVLKSEVIASKKYSKKFLFRWW